MPDANEPGTTAPPPSAVESQSGQPVAADPTTARAGSAASLRTRTSATFISLLAGTLVLVLLIVFLLENTQRAKVTFLGATGHLPLGLALLIAAIAGALILGLVGTARIAQLRRRVKRDVSRL